MKLCHFKPYDDVIHYILKKTQLNKTNGLTESN